MAKMRNMREAFPYRNVMQQPWRKGYVKLILDSTDPMDLLPDTQNRLVSQMWAPLAACREPARKLW